MLNLADLTTSSTGERCSYEQRLGSVVERYGKDSVQVERMQRMINKVGIVATDLGVDFSQGL